MLKLLWILPFLILSTISIAQPIEEHSLAIGYNNGPVNIVFRDLNTMQLGMVLDHQRNFNKSFSLRSSLHFSYLLPVKYTEGRSYDPTAFAEVTSVQYEYSFFHSRFQLTPCVYYRDKSFNLFLGLGGGVGTFTLVSEYYNTYNNYPEMGATHEDKGGQRQETVVNLGLTPVAGVGFNIGNKGDSGVIELSLAYESWSGLPNNWDFSNSRLFTGFSIQTAYRYNFKH